MSNFLGILFEEPIITKQYTSSFKDSCNHYDMALSKKENYCSQCGTKVEKCEIKTRTVVLNSKFGGNIQNPTYKGFKIEYLYNDIKSSPHIRISHWYNTDYLGLNLIKAIDENELKQFQELILNLKQDNIKFTSGVFNLNRDIID